MQQLELLASKVKRCSKCKEEKPYDAFYKRKEGSIGLTSHCKACRSLVQPAYAAAYKQKHPDNFKQSKRRWYEKNKEPQRIRQEKNYANNYQNNRDKIIASAKRWNAANKAKKLASDKLQKYKRRSLVRSDPERMTPLDTANVTKCADGICSYCLNKHDVLTIDHVIPLSKGGKHRLDNVVAACGDCNRRKAARSILKMLQFI